MNLDGLFVMISVYSNLFFCNLNTRWVENNLLDHTYFEKSMKNRQYKMINSTNIEKQFDMLFNHLSDLQKIDLTRKCAQGVSTFKSVNLLFVIMINITTTITDNISE